MNYKEERKKVEEKKERKGEVGEAVKEIQRLGKRADYMLE